MAKTKQICRVCGAEYQACRSANAGDGMFHWQEVACSPACGAEYLKRVLAGRKKKAESGQPQEPQQTAPVIEETAEDRQWKADQDGWLLSPEEV